MHALIFVLLLCLGIGPSLARPNLLLVLLDQWAAPFPSDTPELAALLEQHLPHLTALQKEGQVWSQHRITTAACTPSRTALLTGRGPWETGVTQTDGVAKPAWDPDMTWLDPALTPTLGHWLETNGFATGYSGKFHMAQVDILGPSGAPLASTVGNGLPNPHMERVYMSRDRLAPFGFHDWIGPDPHGRDPMNTGFSASDSVVGGRDLLFLEQTKEWIRTHQANKEQPWALIWSPVGTHDLATYGDLTRHHENITGFDYPILEVFRNDSLYHVPKDDLATKPSTQRSYHDVYPTAFQPISDPTEARAIYYTLMSRVDQMLGAVLDEVDRNTTWIVVTADHGELLGSHDGLWQKWHVAYDAVLRVPMVWVPPRDENRMWIQQDPGLTSHLDVLPRLIEVLDLDKAPCCFVLGSGRTKRDRVREASFFMTTDHPTHGVDQRNWLGVPYAAVQGPVRIASWVYKEPGGSVWKINRYSGEEGEEEYEWYDLDTDPDEVVNLAYGNKDKARRKFDQVKGKVERK